MIKDRTRKLAPVDFTFAGKLHGFQEKAVQDVLSRRFGVLQSPTGSGKTVMALSVIAQRRQPTLIIVHGKELMNQWKERVVEFLGIPEAEVGLIGGGKHSIGGRVTIAIINSLYKCAVDVRDRFGFLVVDECHRSPSRTFSEAVGFFDSRFMLGLSATPYRRDGLTKLIHFFLGDRVHEIQERELQAMKQVMSPSLKIRETCFDFDYCDDYQSMISALCQDGGRNILIERDIMRQARKGKGIALVISDRKDHCQVLYNKIKSSGVEARLLTGAITNGNRKEIIKELNQGQAKALVATAQLIGEGFDLPELSAIFLCTPVKFSGRVKQYVGRILRTANGKRKATIYDYVDLPGVLQASFNSRRYVYRELGIAE